MAKRTAAESHGWQHDALQEDLAAHLRLNSDRVVWTNIPVGPAGSIRPDVLALEKSFAHPRFAVWEIKVSRSDFAADCAAGKWIGYLGFAEAVYFAAPAGLITRDDLPKDAGLYLRGADGWRSVRAPRRHRVASIDTDLLLKLLIDGIERHHEVAAVRARRAAQEEWRAVHDARERLGADFNSWLRDRDARLAELEHLKASAAREREKLEGMIQQRRRDLASMRDAALDEIGRALELDLGGFGYHAGLCERIRDRLNGQDMHKARASAVAALERAADAIARALEPLRTSPAPNEPNTPTDPTTP